MKPVPEVESTPVAVFPSGYPGAHPLADAYPLTEEDVAQMMADMRQRKKQGLVPQLNTIQLLADGRIIDGRTRWIACARMGIEPKVSKLTPGATEEALRAFVRSLNDVRRHLTQGQKAMLLVNAIEEAAAQQDDSGKTTPTKSAPVRLEDHAKKAGVSPRSVDQARAIKKHGSKELQEAVEKGTVSLKQAEKRIRSPKATPEPKAEPEAPAEAPFDEDKPPVQAEGETTEAHIARLTAWVNVLYAQLDPEVVADAQAVLRVLPPSVHASWGRLLSVFSTPRRRALQEYLWQELEFTLPTPGDSIAVCHEQLGRTNPLPKDAVPIKNALQWYVDRAATAAVTTPESAAAA